MHTGPCISEIFAYKLMFHFTSVGGVVTVTCEVGSGSHRMTSFIVILITAFFLEFVKCCTAHLWKSMSFNMFLNLYDNVEVNGGSIN